jgi:hypothetical protein
MKNLICKSRYISEKSIRTDGGDGNL